MAINIFEGARRISKVVIAFWLITFIIFNKQILKRNSIYSSPDIFDLIMIAGIAFSVVLFILAFTWAIGWIVRGFMGISKGQDEKG